MEIFDTFYRPDTPSQRYRLMAVTLPPIVAGLLPWIKPLHKWAASKDVMSVAANLWATLLKLWGTAGPYPSPQHLVQAGLVLVARRRCFPASACKSEYSAALPPAAECSA